MANEKPELPVKEIATKAQKKKLKKKRSNELKKLDLLLLKLTI